MPKGVIRFQKLGDVMKRPVILMKIIMNIMIDMIIMKLSPFVAGHSDTKMGHPQL